MLAVWPTFWKTFYLLPQGEISRVRKCLRMQKNILGTRFPEFESMLKNKL
jgi:hypothetical protein